MPITSLDVIREAVKIVRDGGDPNPYPCKLGPYCLRCCLAKAKTDLDVRTGEGLSIQDAMRNYFREVPEDLPLIRARDAVAEWDKGIVHTQESALAMLAKAAAKVVRENTGFRAEATGS